MTPEGLVERLKKALPHGLRSVVLYGSAAADDYLPGRSDQNILVVADRLGLAELDALSGPAAAWARAGNRPPIMFTPDELARSADAFPIELSDMKRSRKILFGDDPLAQIAISPEHCRLQLERELKGKLLDLREAYMRTCGSAVPVRTLMIETLPAFLVLCGASVRLYQDDVPARKLDAVRTLANHVPFDPQVFFTIQGFRERAGLLPTQIDTGGVRSLFETYLRTIEQVIDAVDRRIHSHT